MFKKNDVGLLVLLVLSLTVMVQAGLVVEYDASKVDNQRPEELAVNPWIRSTGFDQATYEQVVTDEGDYLLSDTAYDSDPYNGGDYVNWKSPLSTPMVKGGSDYGIVVKVQPLGDFASSGYSYEWANIKVSWSDDVNGYAICFDQDNDDAGPGTTGSVSKWRYPMVPVISGIDWSIPHTIAVGYKGATDTFSLYLDGEHKVDILSDDFTGGYLGHVAAEQDRIVFGDSTTGGLAPDYSAKWYSVALYDHAVPEPATMSLVALGALLGLRRKK